MATPPGDARFIRQQYLNAVGQAFRSPVGVREAITPMRTLIDNVGFMRENLMQNLFARALLIADEMQQYAQENANFNDSAAHEPPRYPNDHAREQIEGSATRTGDVITIALRHSPKTIMVTGKGRIVTYGGILEANVHGETATVIPTFERFQARFRAEIAQGALLDRIHSPAFKFPSPARTVRFTNGGRR